MTAALFHVQFDVVQRSRGNHAVKVAAYNAAAEFDATDGQKFDFTRKKSEHRGHAVLLPSGAPVWAADAAELWRRAEAAERRSDAQPARLIEFAIPRDVQPEQRMAFARAVVLPWVDDGMAAQLDIHCVTASDGSEQPHAHVILTMRRFDGDKFAANKERGWNERFQAEKGRIMRGEIAERMNGWLAENNLDSRVDHRRAIERGDDTPPERDAPKRSVEAWNARPDSHAAAPFRATIEQRETRRRLRAAQQAASAWTAEARRLDTAMAAVEEKTPGIRKPGRRRGMPPLPWSPDWEPEICPPITEIQRGKSFAVIKLAGGASIIDRGDLITQRGPISDESIAAIARQAALHGWAEVEVTGDLVHRDRLSAALQARGIATSNHGPASILARRQAEKVLAAEKAAHMTKAPPLATPPVAQLASRSHPVEQDLAPSHAPKYVPPWAKGPIKKAGKLE